MLDPDIKVTRQYEDARLGDDSRPVKIIRVEFRVGTFGPFAEHFPKEEYSAQMRDDALNAFARQVRTS